MLAVMMMMTWCPVLSGSSGAPYGQCWTSTGIFDCNTVDNTPGCLYACNVVILDPKFYSSSCWENSVTGIPVQYVNGKPTCPQYPCMKNNYAQNPILVNTSCCEYIPILGCVVPSTTISATPLPSGGNSRTPSPSKIHQLGSTSDAELIVACMTLIFSVLLVFY
jgi:hypothetical protein